MKTDLKSVNIQDVRAKVVKNINMQEYFTEN